MNSIYNKHLLEGIVLILLWNSNFGDSIIHFGSLLDIYPIYTKDTILFICLVFISGKKNLWSSRL